MVANTLRHRILNTIKTNVNADYQSKVTLKSMYIGCRHHSQTLPNVTDVDIYMPHQEVTEFLK